MDCWLGILHNLRLSSHTYYQAFPHLCLCQTYQIHNIPAVTWWNYSSKKSQRRRAESQDKGQDRISEMRLVNKRQAFEGRSWTLKEPLCDCSPCTVRALGEALLWSGWPLFAEWLWAMVCWALFRKARKDTLRVAWILKSSSSSLKEQLQGCLWHCWHGFWPLLSREYTVLTGNWEG